MDIGAFRRQNGRNSGSRGVPLFQRRQNAHPVRIGYHVCEVKNMFPEQEVCHQGSNFAQAYGNRCGLCSRYNAFVLLCCSKSTSWAFSVCIYRRVRQHYLIAKTYCLFCLLDPSARDVDWLKRIDFLISLAFATRVACRKTLCVKQVYMFNDTSPGDLGTLNTHMHTHMYI